MKNLKIRRFCDGETVVCYLGLSKNPKICKQTLNLSRLATYFITISFECSRVDSRAVEINIFAALSNSKKAKVEN